MFAEMKKRVTFWFASESKPGEFNYATNSTQALNGKDLTNKVAVVTGANTGIGKETAKTLLQGNATVVMGCRSLERGEAARQDIINALKSTHPDIANNVKLLQLDLNDLGSVKQFSNEFNNLNLPCHYLIENAGVMALPEYQTTKQGLERQWGINHISHFYLGNLMLPKLQEDPPSRLIALSSSAHRMSPNIEEWLSKHEGTKPSGPSKDEYDPWKAYGLSKMSNIMFAQEFNRRYQSSGVTAVSVHPGFVRTDLARNMPAWQTMVMKLFVLPFSKTVPQGAATTLRCVSMSDDEITGGGYYFDCQLQETKEDGRIREGVAVEETPQFRMWGLSAQIISGLGFET